MGFRLVTYVNQGRHVDPAPRSSAGSPAGAKKQKRNTSFNYQHLDYDWVVVKEGGIARATEKLGMAVQTVSAQVREMERELERSLGYALLKPVGEPNSRNRWISSMEKVRVAREVQQGIQQHGAVPVGQHHAVAVPPGGLSRVELEVPRVKRSGNFGHAQRHALMPFLGTGDRIDGQKSDGMCQRLPGLLTHFLGTACCAGGCLSPVFELCSFRLLRPEHMNTSKEISGFDE
jgi:hypothetical protein